MKKQVRKKEIKEYNEALQKFGLGNFIDKKAKVEIEDDKFLYVDDELLFFFSDKGLCPTLKFIMKNPCLPKVAVDMPAVPFMVKGADVMRPGIKAADEFKKGDFVVVVDEIHKKPLCICEALFDSAQLLALDKGKVLRNIHYVGDAIWAK